jgi:hypothetical protein
MMSPNNQTNETMIIQVNGTYKILYLKDDTTLPSAVHVNHTYSGVRGSPR